MPRYIWKGITLSGSAQRGTLDAESPEQLKEQLLTSGIALLFCAEQRHRLAWLINRQTSSHSALTTFFEYLLHLLESGVSLPKALDLVSSQVDHHHLALSCKQITTHVNKGEPLSTALKRYPTTFTPLMVQLIAAGEKTGKLTTALTYLCTYLKEHNKFKKALVQAALFPLFTITFAVIILLGILLCIVPQFEQFFSSLDKTLPPITQALLNTSSWLRSWYSIVAAVSICAGLLIAKFYAPKNTMAEYMAKAPFIGNIIATANLITTLRMLSLFLKAGIPLKDALETIASSLKNQLFKRKITTITNALVAGQGLITQLPTLAPDNDTEILKTFVALGEQTGKLDVMLDKATTIFEEKLNKKLELFALFFQPALMIAVGLVIALIMAAVYIPLFNLAYSVS